MNDQQRSDAEAKLAAPKLFGRKKKASSPAPAPAEEAQPAAAPVTEPVTEPVPETPEATRPLFPLPVEEPVEEPAAVSVAEPATESGEPATESLAPVTELHQHPKPAEPAKAPLAPKTPKAQKPAKAPKPPRERRPLPRPRLTGLQIAGIAGLLVGIFLVLATYGSLHLCADVRGTQTCGGKAGFPLLLAIGIVAVIGGGALLRIYAIRSPMGDSFLAVALVAVITVLFLNNHYDAWWMLIVVPVLSLLAYLLSHWVSTKYIDPTDD